MIYAEPSVSALASLGKSAEETEFARVAVFYILAASLLGPILAIVGWVAIKFLFNLMEDSLSHVLPKIFRPFATSVPLILLLLAVWTWQAQINDWIWTSYLTAERTVDTALSFTVKE